MDTSPHKSGFVSINEINLHYLDWGETARCCYIWQVWGVTRITLMISPRAIRNLWISLWFHQSRSDNRGEYHEE